MRTKVTRTGWVRRLAPDEDISGFDGRATGVSDELMRGRHPITVVDDYTDTWAMPVPLAAIPHRRCAMSGGICGNGTAAGF